MTFTDKLKQIVHDTDIFIGEAVEYNDRYTGSKIKVVVDKILIGTKSVNCVPCNYPDQHKPFIISHYYPIQFPAGIKKEIKHYLAYFKKISKAQTQLEQEEKNW